MNAKTPIARINSAVGRGLLGVAITTVVLTAVGCSSSTPGIARPAPTTGPTGPAGLPGDWSAQAIRAAKASFQTCVQANSLQPPNCPQRVEQGLGSGEVLAVHWTVLNQPLDHAVAVPVAQSDQSGGTANAGQVAVYGHYQMEVSYTTSGQSLRPYLDYAGGIAAATMTWDGRSFQNVEFEPGPATGLPAAVQIAPFSRPSGVTDSAVVHAVQAGFQDCVTLKVTPSMTTPPDCPNGGPFLDPYFAKLKWALTGDPLQGALVSFDPDHGNFAVTGSASMTLNAVRIVPGQAAEPRTFNTNPNYTATLAWDGHQLSLLKI